MDLYIAYLDEFSDNEYNHAFSLLDDSRKSAVMRYKSERDRKRSVLGEYLARKGIAKACGMNEANIRFARTEKGKPYALNADIFFSISHSKSIVVCAIDDNEIGVDAELVRDIELRVTKIACTESDKEYIFESDAGQVERFYDVWTAKEAYFKYLGTGIEGLKTVDYKDILPYCTQKREGDYLITVYTRKKQ